MSELAPQITDVISNWLYQEAVESSSGLNAVLDGYPEQLKNQEFIFLKQEGHYDRMKVWLNTREGCQTQAEKDKCAALITFGGLMMVSGSYRRECFVTASSKDDYMDKRIYSRSAENPVGVNVGNITRVRLNRIEQAGGAENLDICELADSAFSSQRANTDRMVEWLRYPDQYPGLTTSKIASFARRMQTCWLGFCIESVAISLAERGNNLAAVPMMKPMSISNPDQALEYPFVAN